MRTRAIPAPRRAYRLPNLVIATRVALAFVTVGLYTLSFPWATGALALTALVIWMDALDGQLARRLDVASDLGAVMDITADRIVEHVFWIFFALSHAVGAWVPILVVTRSFVVDAARSLAFAQGETAFGDKTMMRSPLGRFLVASRFMRNAYGCAKVGAFLLLGAVATLSATGAPRVSPGLEGGLLLAAQALVLTAVALNLARGIPVVWESRRYVLREA